MATVEWSTPAFEQLEALTERVAFEVVRRVDLLESFPEMSVSLRSRYPQLQNCRQLLVDRKHRVVYEYKEKPGIVYILAVQNCRQQLPTAGEIKRSLGPTTD